MGKNPEIKQTQSGVESIAAPNPKCNHETEVATQLP
jgi:hypothetical protein